MQYNPASQKKGEAFMRRPYLFILSLSLLLVFLSACGGATDQAAAAVEGYLTALVGKDSDSISALSCADWELQALLELDSFQAVETRLDGLACTSVLEEDRTSSVTCTGNILATYNGEEQKFDLSLRTYAVVEQGGEYLVCGYR
jgi:hypothetical protein